MPSQERIIDKGFVLLNRRIKLGCDTLIHDMRSSGAAQDVNYPTVFFYYHYYYLLICYGFKKTDISWNLQMESYSIRELYHSETNEQRILTVEARHLDSTNRMHLR